MFDIERLYLSHRIGCLKPVARGVHRCGPYLAALTFGWRAEVVRDPGEARTALRRYDVLS